MVVFFEKPGKSPTPSFLAIFAARNYLHIGSSLVIPHPWLHKCNYYYCWWHKRVSVSLLTWPKLVDITCYVTSAWRHDACLRQLGWYSGDSLFTCICHSLKLLGARYIVRDFHRRRLQTRAVLSE